MVIAVLRAAEVAAGRAELASGSAEVAAGRAELASSSAEVAVSSTEILSIEAVDFDERGVSAEEHLEQEAELQLEVTMMAELAAEVVV